MDGQPLTPEVYGNVRLDGIWWSKVDNKVVKGKVNVDDWISAPLCYLFERKGGRAKVGQRWWPRRSPYRSCTVLSLYNLVQEPESFNPKNKSETRHLNMLMVFFGGIKEKELGVSYGYTLNTPG